MKQWLCGFWDRYLLYREQRLVRSDRRWAIRHTTTVMCRYHSPEFQLWTAQQLIALLDEGVPRHELVICSDGSVGVRQGTLAPPAPGGRE